MIRGELSELQRDAAWEGKDLAERKAMTAHNLNMGGEGNARAAGLRGNAHGLQREENYTERKKREERFEQALRSSIEMSPEAQALHGALGNYANDLRDELARRQRRSDELRDKIDATEAVLVLIQNGELDRDNPHHQGLLERAGLDPDRSDEDLREDAENNLDGDRQELSENDGRIAEIERQLPHVEEARRRLEAGADPAEVLRDLEAEGIFVQVNNHDRDHVFDRMSGHDRALKQELEHGRYDDDSASGSMPQPIDVDQEIESFMQALAGNQMLMMSGSTLIDAMRAQVDGLSDEAREQLSASEETAFLFVEPAMAPQQEANAQVQHDVTGTHDPDLSNLPGNNL